MKNPKSILITGASSGIGEALAIEYAEAGITLFLSGRNLERLEKVKNTCDQLGAETHIKQIDVTDEAGMSDWMIECDQLRTLDLVIANAGIGKGYTTDKDLGEHCKMIMDINVNGVFNTVHPAIRLMQPRERGQIAIISSLAGYHGLATAPIYSTSKATVKAYGEGLRGLYAKHGIKVNVACPGYVKSALTDTNNFPMPFLMETDKAVKLLRRGLEKNHGPYHLPLAVKPYFRFYGPLFS